jgi:hypothetical protein
LELRNGSVHKLLTVTPSAKNAAGQPLQLQPIQLTLTVN